MANIEENTKKIIYDRIDTNNEIGFLWNIHQYISDKKENSLQNFLDFLHDEKGSEKKVVKYLDFLDMCFDKYNYYKNKKGLDEKTAKLYSINGMINYTKREFSEKIKNRGLFNGQR